MNGKVRPMATNESQQSTQLIAVNLFKYSTATALMHLLFAIFLVFTSREFIAIDYASYWLALLVCALLSGLLCKSVFNRTKAQQTESFDKWENTLVYPTIVVSSLFSLAYFYTVTNADSSLWTMIAFIAVMHTGSFVMAGLYSKKIILASILPVPISLLTAFVIIALPLPYILATSVGIFCSLMLYFSLSVNRSLVTGFNMQDMYEKEVKQSDYFRTKVETSTFEDPQTGIFNRRIFDFIINEEIRRAKRIDSQLSLVIIEIDCFSEYQVHYSASKVEECICSVANILAKATSRGGEFITRFDKQRFALVIPNGDKLEAFAFSSKLLDFVNRAELEHLHSSVEGLKTVSISIGIAEFTKGSIIDIEDITAQALTALANAKQKGGNKIATFSEEMPRTDTLIEEKISSDITTEKATSHV
ncbi:MAG: diguanylate cyclase (GGDEF)-like protein [Glaciecola sp.]|jgi:diguanylate cyclase (GGDEF)-like protein